MFIPEVNADYRLIDHILYSGCGAEVVAAALDSGLFDALDESSLDIKELAERLGTAENITEALCNVLVSMKLLQGDGRNFSLTPEAREFMPASSAKYQGDVFKGTFKMCSSIVKQLPELLKAGAPALDNKKLWTGTNGMPNWAMGGSLQDVTGFITELPGFAEMEKICDLGGSHGFYTMALLDRNPELRGTVCDLPQVVESARETIERMGYQKRLALRAVDIETDDAFGRDFDLVLTSHVLYPWKGRLKRVFAGINKALKPGGWFVSNHFTRDEDGSGPMTVAMIELVSVMLGYPGRHFMEDELKTELEACGFGDFIIRPAKNATQDNSLILAARKL